VRAGSQSTFMAHSKGVLSLREGGLDLDNMDWLHRVDNPLTWTKVTNENNRFLWLRIVTAILGIVLILFALFRLWKKEITKSQISSLAIVPFFFLGCAPTGNGDIDIVSDLRTVPAVLDFGRVRHADSPVNLTFEIVNDSEASVTISSILSGCGCTAIDISDEHVPSKGKISVSAKVNLHGRRGAFEEMMLIRFDDSQSQPILLPLTIRDQVPKMNSVIYPQLLVAALLVLNQYTKMDTITPSFLK
jgi:hypothetical protein